MLYTTIEIAISVFAVYGFYMMLHEIFGKGCGYDRFHRKR